VVVDVLSRLPNISEPLGVPRLDYRCIIIFYKTYMDARGEELLRDKLNAKNFELSSKTKVSQKARTFGSKIEINVQSGTR
jgi:hypothetical protein